MISVNNFALGLLALIGSVSPMTELQTSDRTYEVNTNREMAPLLHLQTLNPGKIFWLACFPDNSLTVIAFGQRGPKKSQDALEVRATCQAAAEFDGDRGRGDDDENHRIETESAAKSRCFGDRDKL